MDQAHREGNDMAKGCPIAVVIPTQNRPTLLARAVRTVLSQTLPPREVLIILDDPSIETLAELSHWSSSPVRSLRLPVGSGPSDARNFGIQNTESEWVAFLDDDDEWLPRKLEVQAQAAYQSKWTYPIVCSRMLLRTESGDFIQPLRAPLPSEKIDEYLFCRKTFAPGETFLQTSNLFVSRALLRQVSFHSGQFMCEDTDWLLRAASVSGTGLEFIPEVLSIYHTEDGDRHTLSGSRDWRYVFGWIKENRHLLTGRAYSGAIVKVFHLAVQQGDRSAVKAITSEFLAARPSGLECSLFFILLMACWTLPCQARYYLRVLLRQQFQKRMRWAERLPEN
jgi:glycosyltransferase involved in cell wall biosynthesis